MFFIFLLSLIPCVIALIKAKGVHCYLSVVAQSTSLCSGLCDRGATHAMNPHCHKGASSIETHFYGRYHARKYETYHLVMANVLFEGSAGPLSVFGSLAT